MSFRLLRIKKGAKVEYRAVGQLDHGVNGEVGVALALVEEGVGKVLELLGTLGCTAGQRPRDRVAVAGVIQANEQGRRVEVVVLRRLNVDVGAAVREGESVVLDDKAEDVAHVNHRWAGWNWAGSGRRWSTFNSNELAAHEGLLAIPPVGNKGAVVSGRPVEHGHLLGLDPNSTSEPVVPDKDG